MPRLHDGRRRRSGGFGTSAAVSDNALERRDVSAESNWPSTDIATGSTNDNGEAAKVAEQHQQLPTTAPPSTSTAMTPQVSHETAPKEAASSTASRFAALQKKKLKKKRRSGGAASFAEDESFSFGNTAKRPRKSSPNATAHAASSTATPKLPITHAEGNDFPTVTPAVSCCASVDSGTVDPDHLHALGVKLSGCGGARQHNNNNVTKSLDSQTQKNLLWKSPQTSKPAPVVNNNAAPDAGDRVSSLEKELQAIQERHRLELEQQETKHKQDMLEWEKKCQEKDNTIQELQGKDAISIAKEEEHANEIKGKDDTIKNLEELLANSKAAQDEAVDVERRRITALWEKDNERLMAPLQTKIKTMATTIQEISAAQRDLTQECDRQKGELDSERSKLFALQAMLGQGKNMPSATPDSSSSSDNSEVQRITSAKQTEHAPALVLEASRKFQHVSTDYRGLLGFATDETVPPPTTESVRRKSPRLSPPSKRRGRGIPLPSFVAVEKGISLDDPHRTKPQRSRRKSH